MKNLLFKTKSCCCVFQKVIFYYIINKCNLTKCLGLSTCLHEYDPGVFGVAGKGVGVWDPPTDNTYILVYQVSESSSSHDDAELKPNTDDLFSASQNAADNSQCLLVSEANANETNKPEGEFT